MQGFGNKVSEAATSVLRALTEAYSAVRPLAEQPTEALLQARAAGTMFNIATASSSTRATPADYAEAAERTYKAKDTVRAAANPVAPVVPTPIINISEPTVLTPGFGSRSGG